MNTITARLHRRRALSYLRAARGYVRDGLDDLAQWARDKAGAELRIAWFLRATA